MASEFHISFDLDGTLIDSLPLMRSSWENVCNEFSLKIGWENYRANIGLPFDDICRNLGLEDLSEDIAKVYFDYNKDNINQIQLNRGVLECLQQMRKDDVSWSIITSKPRYTTLDIMDRFDFKPACLICSDDVIKGKPYPEAAHKLKARLPDLPLGNTFYVGDTVSDHSFAINSGFKFIEFSDQQFPDDELGDNRTIGASDLLVNPRKIFYDMVKVVDYVKSLSDTTRSA